MRQELHEIGRIEAEPKGAAETVSAPLPVSGCPGRKGARCDLTPIGPMPGPPPPWGMQKVLCKLRWPTSAPTSPGLASPTSAFMLAPSRYTWPPFACVIAQISRTVSSNTPWVDGYVIMHAARLPAFASALARKSATSMLPSASVATTTTFMPHMDAEAGLVPCAEAGMRQTLRF